MKKISILALAGFAASLAQAQATFIAGWDFDGVNGVESVVANWGVQGSQFGTGTASFYWNGTGPSTDFATGNPPISFVTESAFSGVNAAVGNEFLVVNAAGSSGFDQFSDNFPNSLSNLQFLGNSGGIDNDRAVIQFNAASFTGLSIQFAASNNGSGLVDFTYSTDGINFQSLQAGSNYGSSFEVDTIDLSVLNGAATAYIGVEFSNAASDVFAFDNIQITGVASAIPEPSAFAALAGIFGLGFAASRRRVTRK